MKNKKKSKKGLVVGGGAVIIAAGLLWSGIFNIGLPGQKTPPNEPPQAVVSDGQEINKTEIVLEIKDNQLYYQDKALAVEKIAETFKSGQRVVVKSSDAKQLFYDDVIAALNKAGCVVIEE